MPTHERPQDPAGSRRPVELVERLEAELRWRLDRRPGAYQTGLVASDLAAAHAALQSVLDRNLARGPVFCEWGSGLAAVCALAASLSFEAHGIEIQADLVEEAEELLSDVGLEAKLRQGTFLLPGDEELVADCPHTRPEVSLDAYRGLGLLPGECDVIYAFPWPGEEEMHDRVFLRHATPGALLLTFHEGSRLLAQRRTRDDEELESLGWLGMPGD